MQRDYEDAPPPTVVLFHPQKDTLEDIRAKIQAARGAGGGASRIVVHASEPHIPAAKHVIPTFLRAAKQQRKDGGATRESDDALRNRAAAWATDSVGLYPGFTSFADELLRYGQLPSLKGIRGLPLVDPVITHIRTCENSEKGRTLSNGQWVSRTGACLPRRAWTTLCTGVCSPPAASYTVFYHLQVKGRESNEMNHVFVSPRGNRTCFQICE